MQNTVGMITIYRKNYGAFLQAYALQQALITWGFKPEIIRYDYYKDHTILGIEITKLRRPLHFCKLVLIELLRYSAHRRKEVIFDKSIVKNIHESSGYYRRYKDLVKAPPQYDLYITGSDQVFNAELSHQALNARLLSFVKYGRKMSYAASAGRDRIPEAYTEVFRKALNSFSVISIRERGLCSFIKKEYRLDAVQNVDPTFLLTKDEWLRFAKYDERVQGQFIFYYRVQQQNALKERTNLLSEQMGLPVFVADTSDSFPNQINRDGILSPEKWVGMMQRAAYVVTNSFHGAAFAINLEKRASIFIPPVGGERVKDLLQNCGFEAETYMDLTVAYEEARNYFQKEREKASDLFNELKRNN